MTLPSARLRLNASKLESVLVKQGCSLCPLLRGKDRCFLSPPLGCLLVYACISDVNSLIGLDKPFADDVFESRNCKC